MENIDSQNVSSAPLTKKKKRIPTSWAIGIIVLALIIMGISENSSSQPTPTAPTVSTPSVSSPKVGDNATIQVPGAGPDSAPVFYTEAYLDQYIRSAVAHDTYGMAQVVTVGGFFVNNGDRVLIIDKTATKTKFRFLSGEHAGESAWLPNEFVR